MKRALILRATALLLTLLLVLPALASCDEDTGSNPPDAPTSDSQSASERESAKETAGDSASESASESTGQSTSGVALSKLTLPFGVEISYPASFEVVREEGSMTLLMDPVTKECMTVTTDAIPPLPDGSPRTDEIPWGTKETVAAGTTGVSASDVTMVTQAGRRIFTYEAFHPVLNAKMFYTYTQSVTSPDATGQIHYWAILLYEADMDMPLSKALFPR